MSTNTKDKDHPIPSIVGWHGGAVQQDSGHHAECLCG